MFRQWPRNSFSPLVSRPIGPCTRGKVTRAGRKVPVLTTEVARSSQGRVQLVVLNGLRGDAIYAHDTN